MTDAILQSTFDKGKFMERSDITGAGRMVEYQKRHHTGDTFKKGGKLEEPKVKAKRKAERIAANKRKRIAPTPDDETSRRAAQRQRARTRAGTGRVGTMLSSDTLG